MGLEYDRPMLARLPVGRLMIVLMGLEIELNMELELNRELELDRGLDRGLDRVKLLTVFRYRSL